MLWDTGSRPARGRQRLGSCHGHLERPRARARGNAETQLHRERYAQPIHAVATVGRFI